MGRYEPFDFSDKRMDNALHTDFVLAVPSGIQSKEALLVAVAKAAGFPSHFGLNWDAFEDCLADLSWIPQRRVIIHHTDLPLVDNEAELRIYLDVMATSVRTWRESREGPFVQPPDNMPYVQHELLVIFPSSVESTISRILHASG